MPRQSETDRIRREAEAICSPYNIAIAKIDRLPKAAGGDYAVNLSLPPGFATDNPQVREAISRLQAIQGVTSVFLLLAQKPG